jgi:hypothetical protein
MKILNFGTHKGRSFEWLFFHAPWYAQWLHSQDTQGRWVWYNQEDKAYFNELYRRASHLTGLVCPYCKKRPITRMCLLYNPYWQGLNNVKFDCDECGYPGGAPDGYVRPSFFPPGEDRSKTEYKLIVSAIRNHFVEEGRLTQKRMEEFFRTDRYFPRATPGFFDYFDDDEEEPDPAAFRRAGPPPPVIAQRF